MTDFYELAERAERDPSSMDFAALRQAYVQSGDAYRPLKHITQQKLLQITDSANGFEEVRDLCLNILKSTPLDLEARMLLGVAYEKLGDTDKAQRTHDFSEKMLDTILATGDGKSFESPIKLVAENEAWTVMRAFGIKAKQGERVRKGDVVFDVFQGALEDRQVTIYFDVTDPVRVLDATLKQNDD